MSKEFKPLTREIICKVMAKENPSKYGELINEDGSANISALEHFGDIPSQANDFVSTLNNLVGRQYAFDLLRGWESPFGRFQRSTSQLGAIEQFLANNTDTGEVEDYSVYADGSKLTDVNKPTTIEQFFTITLKKVATQSYAYEIIKGAFLTDNGLNNLMGIMIKNLEDRMTIYLYDYIIEQLNGKFNAVGEDPTKSDYRLLDTQKVALTRPSGDQTQDVATNLENWKKIHKVIAETRILNRKYNEMGKRTITPAKSMIGLIAPSLEVEITSDVMASLFNSEQISPSKLFNERITLDFTNGGIVDSDIVLVAMDDEKMYHAPYIKETTGFYNPSNMVTTYWLHLWVKFIFVNFRQIVFFYYA